MASVIERESKNLKNPTGEIEIDVETLEILNPSKTPPFTIEDDTDGGDDLEDAVSLPRPSQGSGSKQIIMLRHRVGMETRKYLDSVGFIDVETPYLIT